tara:strand:- start:517 stop:879 length:363 start_codon:yes stop_codon:yes gene_type:complete
MLESRDLELKIRWENLISYLTNKFSDSEDIDVEGVLYLIGLQELGQINKTFKKDDNVNIIHIAICTVLEPYGFYEFDYFDNEKWPHFKFVKKLPPLKPGEQSILMKEAIVQYFVKKEVID